MRASLVSRLAVLGFSALCIAPMLSACDSLRDEAGLTKKPPDEFAVTTKAPLIIPPNFNLRPPTAGAAPLNQSDPTSSAQAALFNSNDPETVAAGMRGNYTPGERLLLANAGVQNADPAIRSELNADASNTQAADPDFTDRLLNGKVSKSTVPASKTPATIQKDRGWFDWL